jgi:hypothetical protein
MEYWLRTLNKYSDKYSLGTTSIERQYPVLRWHCAYVGTARLLEHVAFIQLNSIKQSDSVLEKHCVFL